MWGRKLLFLGLAVILTACDLMDSNTPTPTHSEPTMASVEMVATHNFLTENAPPSGFSEVHYSPLDANLSDHPGWSYTMTGNFTGTFDDTGEAASGQFQAQVQADELGERRRVVLNLEGEAFAPDAAPLELEGVRLSNDYYTIDVNGQCKPGDTVIADLATAQLIGGVVVATPTGHRKEINGVPAWQYGFSVDAVLLPPTTLKLNTNSSVVLQADLWVAPDVNAVVLFEMTLNVEHVRLLSGARDVSGTLYLRYELNLAELDVQPNISVPHGC